MTRRASAFSSLLLVVVLPVLAGNVDDMPKILHVHEIFPYPAWVAEDLTLDAKGEPDPTLFPDHAIETFEKYRQLERREKDGCIELQEVIYPQTYEVGNPKSELRLRRDVESSVQLADWIFVGDVTGTAPGFKGQTPGTLIRIEPRKTLKGPQKEPGPFYIFMPVGQVFFGDLKLCKTDRRYPELPQTGEQMLLMVELNAVNSGSLLGVGFRFVVIRHDGTLDFPDWFDDIKDSFEKPGLGEVEVLIENSTNQHGNQFKYVSFGWIGEKSLTSPTRQGR